MYWYTATLVVISLILTSTYGETIPDYECPGTEEIQQMIQKTITMPTTCDDDDQPYDLFQIISCPTNFSQWIDNLEILATELKQNNKLKSIYSVIILINSVEIDSFRTINEQESSKLASIKKELPEITEKIASSLFCLKVDEGEKKYKSFIIPNRKDEDGNPIMKKFVVQANGSISAATGTFGDQKVTLLMEKFPDTNYDFDFPLEIENGNLEDISTEESHEVTSYSCLPIMRLLAETLAAPKSPASHFCVLSKFIIGLINSV